MYFFSTLVVTQVERTEGGHHVHDSQPFFTDDLPGQPVNPRLSKVTPRKLWLLLHEPRIVTFFQGIVWAIVSLTGAAALTVPPSSIAHSVGPLITSLWGMALFGGGILGLVGCLPGWWWVERTGILASGTGVIVYLVVILNLHATTPGNRLVQAGFVVWGLFSLVIRWVRISGMQTDPTRGVNA